MMPPFSATKLGVVTVILPAFPVEVAALMDVMPLG
jgi:hypothetical protein